MKILSNSRICEHLNLQTKVVSNIIYLFCFSCFASQVLSLIAWWKNSEDGAWIDEWLQEMVCGEDSE